MSLWIVFLVLCSASVSKSEDVDYEPKWKTLNDGKNSRLELFQRFPESVWFNYQDVQHSFINLNNGKTDINGLMLNRNSSDNSSICEDDLVYTVLSLKKIWAIQMIDAAGKPQPGLLSGSLNWPGNFDSCLEVSAPPSKTYPLSGSPDGFKGRYCSMTVNLKLPTTRPVTLPIRVGICVPSSCREENLKLEAEIFKNYAKEIPIIRDLKLQTPVINDVTCAPEPDEVKLDSGTIGCIFLIVMTCFIVAVGTLYDIYIKYFKPCFCIKIVKYSVTNETEDEVEKETTSEDTSVLIETEKPKGLFSEILTAFSVLENAASILDTKPRDGQLDCVHGIRFLSLSWVILGHTIVTGTGTLANPLDLMKELDKYTFQAILQAPFAVDTFFLLSGFLLTYLFMKDATPMTWTKWVYFYIHRFIRLTPVYMMMLFIFATLWNYLGDGPFWMYSTRGSNFCTKNWWWNLLYINNFLTSPKQCFAWGWYLANDMQFYVISPIFLVWLKSARYRFMGMLMVGALLLVSWITTGIISNRNAFPIMFNSFGNGTTEDAQIEIWKEFDVLYDKPWIRIGPYLVGAFLAYCILETKRRNWRIHWSVVTIGWCVAIILNVTVVYGLYKATPNVDVSAFYNTVARSTWAMSVAWVIFACLTGNGGPVNCILSWPAWYPLSRLTYCAYLVHPMIMSWYFSTLRSTTYYTHSTVAIHFLGFMMISYGFAFVVSLVYEAPVIKIEKILRRR